MKCKIITPYVFENEIKGHKQQVLLHMMFIMNVMSLQIGCDLMFQKMWKQFPDDDIFILHADMAPHHDGWFEEVF